MSIATNTLRPQTSYLAFLRFVSQCPECLAHPKVAQTASNFFHQYAKFDRLTVYSFLSRYDGPYGAQFQPAMDALKPIVLECLNQILDQPIQKTSAKAPKVGSGLSSNWNRAKRLTKRAAEKVFGAQVTAGMLSPNTANLASFIMMNYKADVVRMNKDTLRRALLSMELPTHRHMFRRFREQFSNSEVLESFFTLKPSIPTLTYLFTLFVLSRRIETAQRESVEKSIKSLMAKCTVRYDNETFYKGILEAHFSHRTKNNKQQKVHKTDQGNSKRVALLLSGQMRDYSKLVTLVDELRQLCELDVYVSTWNTRGSAPIRTDFELREYSTSIRPLIRAAAQKHNIDPKTFHDLYHLRKSDVEVAEPELRTALDPKAWTIDIEGNTTPKFGENQERMFYKISSVFDLVENTTVYDAFVRMRPDLQFDLTTQDIMKAVEGCNRADPVVFLRNMELYDFQVPFVDDNFCVTNLAGMEIYRSTFDGFRKSGIASMGNPATKSLRPHEGLALWLLHNGVEIDFIAQDTEWKYSSHRQYSASEYADHLRGFQPPDEGLAFVKELVADLAAST